MFCVRNMWHSKNHCMTDAPSHHLHEEHEQTQSQATSSSHPQQFHNLSALRPRVEHVYIDTEGKWRIIQTWH